MGLKEQTISYILALLIIVSFGIAGTYFLGQRGGFNIKITSFSEAAYFTIATISTVGYGDIYPITNTARIFVVALILAGVGIFIGGVVALSGEFVTSRIENIRGKLSVFDRRFLSNHIILIGTNETNLSLAENLKEKNEKFIMITTNPETAESLRYQNMRAYVADAASESSIRDFGFEKAKAIVIDLRDSSRTIYVLLVATGIAKKAKIIVVAPTKQAEKYIRNLTSGKAVVINTADIVARTVSEKLLGA